MQDKYAQAAKLLDSHKKAKQVQPGDYIAGNKRVMAADLTSRKQDCHRQSSLRHAQNMNALLERKNFVHSLHTFCIESSKGCHGQSGQKAIE